MKRVIRLTENDLHKIIKESVKRILRESDETKYAGPAARAASGKRK